LDVAFQEFHRVLQPEGLLMFSTFGPDTLRELRVATSPQGVDENHHTSVSRFIDMHDIGDALVRAGFSAPVLDVERFTLTYDDVKSVMRDLKSIGAHNATDGRARGLQGRGFLHKLETAYEQFRTNGKLPATFEVVYGHAWKAQEKLNLGEGVSPVTFKPRSK
jgi:malonyl-CoA O-methyltransferase